MINYEYRALQLTRALEDLLECFDDRGGTWSIQAEDDTPVKVHPDVEEVIERGLNILYDEEDVEDIEDPDRFME